MRHEPREARPLDRAQNPVVVDFLIRRTRELLAPRIPRRMVVREVAMLRAEGADEIPSMICR